MIMRNFRRRLSLLIYPQWIYETAAREGWQARDPYRKLRRTQLLKLADLFVEHHASTIHGCITDRCGEYDYCLPNRTAEAVVRLKKNPGTCPAVKTHKIGIQWFSDHWPSDLDWPSDIPRPLPSSAPHSSDRAKRQAS